MTSCLGFQMPSLLFCPSLLWGLRAGLFSPHDSDGTVLISVCAGGTPRQPGSQPPGLEAQLCCWAFSLPIDRICCPCPLDKLDDPLFLQCKSAFLHPHLMMLFACPRHPAPVSLPEFKCFIIFQTCYKCLLPP